MPNEPPLPPPEERKDDTAGSSPLAGIRSGDFPEIEVSELNLENR